MDNANDDVIIGPLAWLGPLAPLAEVRADLNTLEAIEDEIRQRVADLRAMLGADQYRLVWALQDAEQRLGLAERMLAERRFVEGLARCLPEHAATIHTAARHLLGEEVAAGKPA